MWGRVGTKQATRHCLPPLSYWAYMYLCMLPCLHFHPKRKPSQEARCWKHWLVVAELEWLCVYTGGSNEPVHLMYSGWGPPPDCKSWIGTLSPELVIFAPFSCVISLSRCQTVMSVYWAWSVIMLSWYSFHEYWLWHQALTELKVLICTYWPSVQKWSSTTWTEGSKKYCSPLFFSISRMDDMEVTSGNNYREKRVQTVISCCCVLSII